MEKARQCLSDAVLYQPIVPRIAGREAYLAAFHAAEALLYERTGRIAKTHRGLRAQFSRLAKDEPSIDPTLSEFLGRGYELKSLADYGTGTEAAISAMTSMAAIATATRFVDYIADLLGRCQAAVQLAEVLCAAVARQEAPTRENLAALARRLFAPSTAPSVISRRAAAHRRASRPTSPAQNTRDRRGGDPSRHHVISELVRTEPHRAVVVAYVAGWCLRRSLQRRSVRPRFALAWRVCTQAESATT